MNCPFHQSKLRPDLPPLPARISALPIDSRGYPIPFFVATLRTGERDFRVADGDKWQNCVKNSLCWVCGQTLGSFKAFILGPMCTVTRTTTEPAMHFECAQWSAQACPFLIKPQMERRQHDEVVAMPGMRDTGIPILRNPGASAVWVTRSFELFPDQHGKSLIRVGSPLRVLWWREGRAATRAEVLDSMDSGFPILRKTCQGEADHKALDSHIQIAMAYLPE